MKYLFHYKVEIHECFIKICEDAFLEISMSFRQMRKWKLVLFITLWPVSFILELFFDFRSTTRSLRQKVNCFLLHHIISYDLPSGEFPTFFFALDTQRHTAEDYSVLKFP